MKVPHLGNEPPKLRRDAPFGIEDPSLKVRITLTQKGLERLQLHVRHLAHMHLGKPPEQHVQFLGAAVLRAIECTLAPHLQIQAHLALSRHTARPHSTRLFDSQNVGSDGLNARRGIPARKASVSRTGCAGRTLID